MERHFLKNDGRVGVDPLNASGNQYLKVRGFGIYRHRRWPGWGRRGGGGRGCGSPGLVFKMGFYIGRRYGGGVGRRGERISDCCTYLTAGR